MAHCRAKYERQDQGSRNRKDKHGRTDARDPGFYVAVRCERGQCQQWQAGEQSSDSQDHGSRIGLYVGPCIVTGHVFEISPPEGPGYARK
jgi:hypothetical protein